MAAFAILQNYGPSNNPVFKNKETLRSTITSIHLADPVSPQTAAFSLLKKTLDSPPATPCSVADTDSTGDDSFTKPCKRRVRFFVDEDDQPITESRGVVGELTLKDRERMWYSSDDFKYFRRYSKKLATIAAKSNYGLEFAKVYETCGSTDVQDITHCSRIANTAARGLEVVGK